MAYQSARAGSVGGRSLLTGVADTEGQHDVGEAPEQGQQAHPELGRVIPASEDRMPAPASSFLTAITVGAASSSQESGLRLSLHQFESEVGGARCLDRTCPPQFDSLRVEILEEPDTAAE
jgi:hypothetical protein